MAAKRRKIVKEDFERGIGTTTIPTDSGGTRSATKNGLHTWADGIYNALDAGCAGNGITDDRAALNTLANSTIPSSGGSIFLGSGKTYRIASNLTLPAHVCLRFAEGAILNVDTGVTVTILGPVEASSVQLFTLTGSGAVKFGSTSSASPVRYIYPQWWGAKNDGTSATETTAAINAAFASIVAFTDPLSAHVTGGICVFLVNGTYAINSSILTCPQQSQTVAVRFVGESTSGTVIAWVGGNTDAMIDLGSTGANNQLFLQVKRMTLINPSTAGTTYATWVRPLAIDGIKLNPTVGAGVNHVLIEDVYFTYLSNGIVSTAAAVNQMTVQRCHFASIYNQTNPVVNPLTDALVSGRGNAIYMPGGGQPPQGNYIRNNHFISVQGYCYQALGANGSVNLIVEGNFMEATNFTRAKFVGLSAIGGGLVISGNEASGSASGNATEGPLLDLGTTSLGSSNTSGGVVTGNKFTMQVDAAGNPVIQITYSDGIFIGGNSFLGLNPISTPSNPGIKLYAATATNIMIGVNNWVSGLTFSKKLEINGGPQMTGFVCCDPAIGFSGFQFDPEQLYELMEDFEGASAAGALTAGNSIDQLRIRWTAAATGTYAFIAGSSTGIAAGVLRITGDGAGGGGGVACSQGTHPFRPNSKITMKCRWAQRGTGAGNRFCGMSSAGALSDNVSNSTYFRHAAGGNIFAVARGGGVDSATLDTGVAAADGVYHTGRMLIDRDANVIDVWLDGIYRGRFANGAVPGSNACLAAGTAATAIADGVDVDYLYASQQRYD